MAVVRSFTERKVPRRMDWWAMIPKKISTMFSHEHPDGVKCRGERSPVEGSDHPFGNLMLDERSGGQRGLSSA